MAGSTSRRKGADFERRVALWFQENGWPLARRSLTPGEDQDLGDLTNIDQRVVVDCKNRAKWDLPAWMRQLAMIKARANAVVGALIVKRPTVDDVKMSYVIMDMESFRDLLIRAGFCPSAEARADRRSYTEVDPEELIAELAETRAELDHGS